MILADSKETKKLMKVLKAHFHKLKFYYECFRNNPYDSGHIHRLRVEMRKLRAMLKFLKPIINQKDYHSLNILLRDLGKELSELRDIDAMIENIGVLAIKQPKLTTNYAALFGYLEDVRLKKAHLIASKKTLRQFDNSFYQVEVKLMGLSFVSEKKSETNLESLIIKRYLKKGKKLRSRLNLLQYDNYYEVHELRKNAKNIRYTSVGFKEYIPKEIRKTQKEKAKKIQEQLGEITDLQVSIDRLNQYNRKIDDESIKYAFQKVIDYQKNYGSNNL